MKIGIVGAGPGGLYFAILAKLAEPSHEITVYERNERDETFGWGVVFSDETLGHFQEADPVSYEAITERFVRWDAIDTIFRNESIRCQGHGFCGLERKEMLRLLAARCESLGVELRFGTEIQDVQALRKDFDLLVAADGINSGIRDRLSEYLQPRIEQGLAKYIWLGCDRVFDAFKFIIRENKHGLFQVHAYPFKEDMSTFIVECDLESWTQAGLDQKSTQETIDYVSELFAPELQGAALHSNRSRWIEFRRVSNATWYHENLVLVGDAAHTAHFSIGSGTKLAMEDAIALAKAIEGIPLAPRATEVTQRLANYQEARWVDVAKLQKSATTSRRWFENISRYRDLSPIQFTAHLLSRSKRITHQNLKERDPEFVQRWDRWFAQSAGLELAGDAPLPPPMFTPFRLSGITLPNRVVVSPMCQYSAIDGVPGDWHMAHLGALARGGAGLVMAEMTAVCPQGRITHGCTGLYTDEQAEAWARIVAFGKSVSDVRFGIQLGHAGRKGSCTMPWEGDRSLGDKGWPTIAPSPIAYDEHKDTPRAFNQDDVEELRAAYVRAAQRADKAGFDLLEVHMAHGYLLGTCLSPLTNRREDEYGQSLEGRAKLPLLIFDAVREVWPKDKALSVRISATDWAPGGFSKQDRLTLAQILKERGCDLIDVSSGQTVAHQAPEYGRMFQTPFADEIRHQVGIPTMAVGAISSWEQINTIIGTGRADLCALARPHLSDPHFTLRAAQEQQVAIQHWPRPYLAVAPRKPIVQV